MTNGEFRGEGLTVTNFAWYDGGINRDGNGSAPVLRVPPGGQFLMKGSATRSYSTYNGNLPGHIVNQGAASWEGGTLSANFFSTFENAGSLAITAPASVAYGGFGAGRFVAIGDSSPIDEIGRAHV